MTTARHSRVLRIVSLVIAFCFVSLPTYATYSGGTGEPNDPYQLATAEDLMLLGETPDDYDKHFILTADIDLNPNLPGRKVFDRAVIGVDWETPFTGVFDGNGHTISHLTITGIDNLGLFGRLVYGAKITTLGLEAIDINGTGYHIDGLVSFNRGSIASSWSTGTIRGNQYVGGLVGSIGWTGRITSSYSTGIITGNWHVGGLVGRNCGIMIGCYSTGEVHGNERIGGLVGSNLRTVTGCHSTTVVDGLNKVGGLVGYNYDLSDVINCYSNSIVNGNHNVGCLVGFNCGSVITSYSFGSVIANKSVGGLVGANDGITKNCYAKGPVTGNEGIGGLVGHNDTGTITNCYSAGLVIGADSAGGLIGSNEGNQIANSFWDIQTSGQTTSAGGIGQTTSKMATARTFLDAGWDFVDEIKNGTQDIWLIHAGWDHPELACEFWAHSPRPQDTGEIIGPVFVSWGGARHAVWHDVFFGEDKDVVGNATINTPDVYRGRLPAEMGLYDPGVLEYGKTYYWRIDEVYEANARSPWEGKVWSFTTADYILVLIVEDFERYTDGDTGFDINVWQVWIDGWDNGTGSQISYLMPPYCELRIVHGGHQSMPFFYDNDGKVDEGSDWERQALFYSEAVRTFDLPWDWTINDADTLTLFFRGEADNDPESLYVGIEDNAGRIAVMTHPDADAVLTTEWQKWHVPLMDMRATGVDLTSVLKIYIGVGDRDNPQPGGAGKIYIDDIRITNRMQ